MTFTFTLRFVRIQKESGYIYRFTPALLNWLSHLILHCSWVKYVAVLRASPVTTR